MRCLAFEKRLSAFLNGDLSAEGRVAMTTHLESCPECRQTAQIVRGDFDLEPEDIPEDFASEVLELTSGTTCRQARHHLCKLADGELSADYAKVVASHLRTCMECSGLFVALTELAEVLPEMVLLEPDASFTADVLARTVRAGEVSPQPNRIQRFLDSIVQRPRFSWEAAYVGTLFMVTVWGVVATPAVLEESAQRLASTQINLVRLADALQRNAAENWITNRTEELNRMIVEQYPVWKSSAANSIVAAREEIRDLPEKSGEYLEVKMGQTLEAISGQFPQISGETDSDQMTTEETPKD